MKYYSETLGKLYDTKKELVDAEQAAEKAAAEKEQREKELKETRKKRAEEIDVAREELKVAREKYYTLVENFAKDFNGYHFTISSNDGLNNLKHWFNLW